MNRALKSALVELKAEGITLDPIADLDHILTLNTLALQISAPDDLPGEAALLQPVMQIGGLTLRHLSMGAKRFLIDVVADWFPKDMKLQDLAYAFCMAHADRPEVLWQLQNDRRAFKKTLLTWEKTITVSYTVLKAAISTFLEAEHADHSEIHGSGDYLSALTLLHRWRPMPEPYRTECEAAAAALRIEAEGKRPSFGWVIEMLAREYGKTAEDWFWRTPETEIETILYNRRERMDAESRALRGAKDDRFHRAHYAFTEYVQLIRRIKKGIAT